jgi:hypothetical protein
MKIDFAEIYDQLFAYCEAERFSGYDPFDGLNSRIFQRLPLKNFAVARLAWLQIVKRSPVNLRKILLIEKGVNSKGLALFALAELARFRATGKEKHRESSQNLLAKLLALKIEIQTPNPETQNRAAFGYNFDWQSRAFFAPLKTPTIVPTAFAARALLEAWELFKNEAYLETMREICRFICADLNRISEAADDEVCFSYTPLDQSIIFNASLLAGETLASVGTADGNQDYLELAARSARFVLRRQQPNGAWAYGSKLRHRWIDNFHTAYILLSLYRLQKLIPDLRGETENALRNGHGFLAR